MKHTHNLYSLFFVIFCLGSFAVAQPTIDTLKVQGYMRLANGNPVTNGTYDIVYGVFQNGGTAIWAKEISTLVTDGMFVANLSGTGTDESVLGAATGMNSDYSAINLDTTLMISSPSGPLSVRVFAKDTIDGNNPQFDIALGAVATSFIAERAMTVAPGAITLTGIATAAKSNVGGGAHAGKICLLNGSGMIDSTMLPTISVANGGTGATSSGAALTALGAASSGANSNITSLSGLTTALSVGQGGTGATAAGAARTNLGAASSGVNSDITSLSGLSTALSVAQGGTGATSSGAALTALGSAAAGANSDITSLSGLTTALSIGQGGTGSTTQNFVDLTNTQTAAGAKTWSSNATFSGNITQSGATTFSTGTGAVSINGSTTVAANISQTGATTFSTGTGAVSINGSTTIAANISQTGATTLSTGTGAITLNGNAAMSAGRSFAVGQLATGVSGTPLNALAHGGNGVVFYTVGAASVINGVVAGVAGQMVTIVWTGAFAVTINNANGGASANDRIYTNTGAALVSTAAGGGSIVLIYLTTASGVANNGWYIVAFNA